MTHAPRVRLISALIAASLVPVTLVPVVHAAPQAALEEVVVTARKRTENLQTVPIAIDAFSEKKIEQLAISSIADVAKYTPSLSFSEGLVPADTRPVLRGLSLVAGRPNVAVLLDGVDLTSSSLIFNGGGSSLASQLFELERIEVVKGPQSTMFGRNAFGGAVNYISKKPTEEFTGSVSADIAEYGRRNVSAEVSGPLIKDKLLYRAGVLNREFDGYYDNTVNGKDLGTENTSGGALALQFLINDKLDATLTTRYTDEDYGEGAVVLVNAPVAPPKPVTNYAIHEMKLDPEKISPDRIALSNMGQNGLNTQTWNSNLTINWDLDFAKFTSITGLNDSASTQNIDNDYTNATGIVSMLDQDIDTQQWSQEFRLASNDNEKMSWLVGAMYFTEDISLDRFDRYAGTTLTFLPIPNKTISANPYPSRDTAQYGRIKQDTDTWAVFGLLSFELTDKWSLTTEARYSEDKIQAEGDDVDGLFKRTLPFDYSAEKFYSFNPRVTLDYQVTDNAMTYASVSKGTKPGGFNYGGFGLTGEGRTFDQEKMWNYEIGAKTNWLDDRLQVNTAIFYMDYKDQAVNSLCTVGSPECLNANAFNPPAYLENAGKSEIKGLELDMSAVLMEGFTGHFNYTYVDSIFADYQTNSAGVTNYVPRDPVTLKADISGNTQPDISKDTISTGLRYEYPIAGDMNLFSQVDAFYYSQRYWDLIERANSGEKFDGNIQVGVEADQWTVTVYGNNLLEDQVSSVREYINQNAGFRRAYVVRLPPEREFGIRAKYSF